MPAPASNSTASPANSSAVNPYQTGALGRLNAAPKLGPIGQAARAIMLESTKENAVSKAGGSTVSAGTEYAKKLIDQSTHYGNPTGKGKGKSTGNCGLQAAVVQGLSGEELRSIIEAEKGIRGAGQRRKFLRDVYAQLSGQLPESRGLAQQLTRWRNDPGFNQLFGYKVTTEGGQTRTETGPTRMQLIAGRLKIIQQVRDQLHAQQATQESATSAAAAETDPLRDTYPALFEEENQLQAEATLVKTVLTDLEKSTKSSGFLTRLFGHSGVKWSPDTQKVFADAVTQDVSRFLADERVFKSIEAMLVIATPDKLTPGPDGITGYSVELTEFHNDEIAGESLPQLQRMLAQLKPTLQNDDKTKHLQSVIAQLEADIRTQLGNDLKLINYLLPLDGGNTTHPPEVYEQVARFFVQHLPDYQRLSRQFATAT